MKSASAAAWPCRVKAWALPPTLIPVTAVADSVPALLLSVSVSSPVPAKLAPVNTSCEALPAVMKSSLGDWLMAGAETLLLAAPYNST